MGSEDSCRGPIVGKLCERQTLQIYLIKLIETVYITEILPVL